MQASGNGSTRAHLPNGDGDAVLTLDRRPRLPTGWVEAQATAAPQPTAVDRRYGPPTVTGSAAGGCSSTSTTRDRRLRGLFAGPARSRHMAVRVEVAADQPHRRRRYAAFLVSRQSFAVFANGRVPNTTASSFSSIRAFAAVGTESGTVRSRLPFGPPSGANGVYPRYSRLPLA